MRQSVCAARRMVSPTAAAQHLRTRLPQECLLSVIAQRCCSHCYCRGTEIACVHNRTCNVAESPDLALQFQQTAASVDHFAWGKSDDGAFSVPARLHGVLPWTPRAASVSPSGRCERTRDWPLPQRRPSVIGCAPDPKWAPAVAWIWRGGRRPALVK
jgi:hypothetical protein